MDNKTSPLFDEISKTFKKTSRYIGVFSLLLNLLVLIVPLYMMQLFDRVLLTSSTDTLIYLTLITGFILLMLSLLDNVRSRILVQFSHWVDRQTHTPAIQRSMDEALRGNPYSARVLDDIAVIRQFLNGSAMVTLFDSPWVPIFLAIIYLLNIWLGVLATLGAIALFLCGLVSEILNRRSLQLVRIAGNKTHDQYQLMINNAETVQAMGMLPDLLNHWSVQHDHLLDHQIHASRRGSVIVSICKFIRLLLQVLMLGVGAYLVIKNQFTPGMMIAGSILLSRALAPVEQSIGAWQQIIQAHESFKRVRTYLKGPELRSEETNLPKPTGHLVVKHVFLQFPKTNKPVLVDINFSVNPGEILVIAGPSASGKTTLARLLMGALPSGRGEIRLDGVNLFKWSREEIGSYIGYLPQRVELFMGTVRDNIARMKTEAGEDVVAAAKAAHIHSMILQLPHGYDTFLEDAGRSLSGGQRQGIAFARALFKEPQLIVLDEPSSYLDAEAQQNLVNTLFELREQKKTVIVITHQPQLLNQADKIVILRGGQQVIYGPPQQVFAALQQQAGAVTQNSKRQPLSK